MAAEETLLSSGRWMEKNWTMGLSCQVTDVERTWGVHRRTARIACNPDSGRQREP